VPFQLPTRILDFRFSVLLAAMLPTNNQSIGRMDWGDPCTLKKCRPTQTMDVGVAKIRALHDVTDYYHLAEARRQMRLKPQGHLIDHPFPTTRYQEKRLGLRIPP
jgi:hypothetical protein